MKKKTKRLIYFLSIIFVIPNLLSNKTEHIETIYLGSGCFWGAEKGYESLDGVIDAESGYANGYGISPNYRSIIQFKNKFNDNNFAEVVKVTFNSNAIEVVDILKHFFETHDPTQLNRQGNDVGTQYRSTILYINEIQKELAEKIMEEYQILLNNGGYGEIKTMLEPLDNFYSAEDYHQDYLKKNPNGYCPDLSTGIVFNDSTKTLLDNEILLTGKQILVLDSQNYCPYCEKLKVDVTDDYKGTIPLSYRTSDQLHGLKINSPTWATPSLIFMENGKEVFSYQGYINHKDFYQLLGKFKLGDSEAYDVAFNKGTDARFCKEYEIFKDTPDGIFVDKLSGESLFDTKDRFVSKSGWLSFTKPVDGSVYELPDNSYGMRRTEIRSVSSDIHLGHVFNDGPNGMPRYCINATVLEFKKRKELS
ncbi:MAG: peptide-methionine (S)-S-oxide reductase [Gammaproteobacteria bacterium]|jgi:peptide methionine sulfoxide reductase msrA/msrB|nr:peptide-methionine (S)-S-oxide reductase [Gammaproteobacteria bacterium]|tara:strand:+ start:30802 stop:32061 length:1260 start_codon:yes stop_codon:yes gene_type:complete